MNNIALIGMPGVGKSTIGIVLAKTLGYSFIDTDILIQQAKSKLLQEIIDADGIHAFLELEERIITQNQYQRSIIATGGSAVLSPKAMAYLGNQSIVVYLALTLESLTKRINNIEARGIVKDKNQTLQDIYQIRLPLYERYANVTIDCSNKTFEAIINEIVETISCKKAGSGKQKCIPTDDQEVIPVDYLEPP
jgi:shikimate kinase